MKGWAQKGRGEILLFAPRYDFFSWTRGVLINELSRSHAAVGAQVFARLALATAHRLRSVDEALRFLQER